MPAKKPSSDVEICNLSLDLLKEPPVTSIDTPVGRKAAEQLQRWYHQERRGALRDHTWNFATKRSVLAPITTEPEFGYDNKFLLPTDFIRLVSIGDDQFIDTVKLNYQIEDGYILTSDLFSTDPDTLKVRYVYDITDVNQFDPLFIDLLVLRIARKLAPKYSASDNVVSVIREELKDAELRAKSVDGQDRPPTRYQRSKLMERRRGLSRRGVAGPFEIIG